MFTNAPWTRALVAPFLSEVFTAHAEMVSPGMIVLASSVHAADKSCFDVLTPTYLGMLSDLLKSDSKSGCSCIYFLGQQKETLIELVKNPAGLEIIRSYLACHKDPDTLSTFLGAMTQVLSASEEKHGEIVKRIFSNVLTPQSFP